MAGIEEFSNSPAIIRRLVEMAPPGAPLEGEALERQRAVTAELIAMFRAEGKLDESPMTLAMERSVDLHADAAAARLKGARVLVTGGAGCVGTRLIPILVELGAAEIAIVDIAEETSSAPKSKTYRVDIRDVDAMDAVFAEFRPKIVFHLASIREPGRAEAVVREAIETNVFGTRNVIEACLRHGVEDAIYSSTGKCFAYVTDHVYTGSKKLAEAQWVVAARKSQSTRFRFTRFTHIMENGLVMADIMAGIDAGIVPLHGPERYFNIQNLRQATHLLINALALAESTVPDGFWSAIDLGWPVNTLELALYHIVESGKSVALRFLGVPKGYDEAFYRGQFDWSDEYEYHPLINALEAPTGFTDNTGTMVGARIQPFSEGALAAQLDMLAGALVNPALDVDQVKQALLDAVVGFTRSVFDAADLSRIVDVLWWGTAPAWAGDEGRVAARFQVVIRLLADVILARPAVQVRGLSHDYRQKLLDAVPVLSMIGLERQADSLTRLLALEHA